MSRIIVIMLGHGHVFGGLQEVTDELSGKIADLAPKDCTNGSEIPVMTAGGDIGSKSVLEIPAEDEIEGIIL